MTATWTAELLRRVGGEALPIPFHRTQPRRRAATFGRWSGLADAILVTSTALVAVFAVPEGALAAPAALGIGGLAALLAVAVHRGFRHGGGGGSFSPEPLIGCATRAVGATAAAVPAAGLCAALGGTDSTALLAWAAVWASLAVPGTAAIRFGTVWLASYVEGAMLSVAVVGPPGRREAFAASLTVGTRKGWRFADEPCDVGPAELARLRGLVASGAVDVVVLAVHGSDFERIRDVCDALADSPVRICLGLDAAGIEDLPLSMVWRGCLPMVDLVTDPHGGMRGAAKRALDIAASTILLAVLTPVLVAVAFGIRLESPGPALFRQRRFGVANEPIEILKFRTMRADQGDPTGERRTETRDPRVTRLGRLLRRTSFDELPQLLNVLRGDMSLVGPRPHALHMKVGGAYYFEAVDRYRSRHRIKPGITGWAQVNGSRGEIDTMEKAQHRVELDLWYIRHWSLWLDLRILLRTALGGFASPGAD